MHEWQMTVPHFYSHTCSMSAALRDIPVARIAAPPAVAPPPLGADVLSTCSVCAAGAHIMLAQESTVIC